jgi:heparan-alpha-glucosaminide N-acetyltransferase
MSQAATLPPPPLAYQRAPAGDAAPATTTTTAAGSSPPASTRLVSLDAYRGFVMLLMASEGLGIAKYVHDTGAGGIWPFLARQTQHVEWQGCALWDLIQPSFTFIVGVAMPFSLAARRARGQSFGWLLFHAIVRSLILICLGIFLRSIDKRQTYFTFEDTLTQIGLGYTFAFLLAWTKPRWQAVAAAAILVGYWLAFALHPLPPAGFDYGKVGVSSAWRAAHGLHGFAAHWDKNTNFAAAADVWFLNLFPRAKPFAYTGGGYLTLSFIPTLGTMLLGLLAGGLMRSRDATAGKRIAVLVIAGLVGLGVGTLLDVTGVCPSVKRIWTPSWVLFSGGWCCLLLAAFYAVIDVAGWRRWAFPLVVVGMNSIAMYCLADGGFRGFIQSSLHTHLGPQFFQHVAGTYAPIAEWSATLLVLWLVLFWMYRRKIFLRI